MSPLQHFCRTGPWPDVFFLDPVVWHLFKIKNLTAYNMELLELLQTLKTQVLLLPNDSLRWTRMLAACIGPMQRTEDSMSV